MYSRGASATVGANMAGQQTAPAEQYQQIGREARAFETYATRVSHAAGARALRWEAIQRSAAAAGMDPRTVAPALAAMNEQATREAAHWQKWVNDLAAGRAELVPYQVGNEPVKLAVRRAAGGMGWWPIVVTVLRVGSQAAMAAGAWLTVDAWQDTRQTEANSRQTDATTRAALTTAAQRDPRIASQLLRTMEHADRAGENAGPDWIDRLGTGVTAAAGGLSSGLILLAAFWYFTQRGKK